MKPKPEKIPLSERRGLHTDEATQYSGLGRTSLYDLARAGQIESWKVLNRRIWGRESLDKLTPQSEP
jgi:hypothetical protein